MSRVRTLAVGAATLAVLLLALAGPLTRLGVWNFRTGLGMLRWAAYLGIAALVLALVALAVTRPRRHAYAAVAATVVLAGIAVGVPRAFLRVAQRVPPIHDITTDTADPPAFVAVLPLRAGAPNGSAYGGDSVAAQQRAGYPDIAPLHVAAPPSVAFARAAAAARAMGWDVVAADSAAGRVEATATTRWFGFKDDVVVRVRPDSTGNGGGSRVDVRSASRVGKSDVGANAARIRAYLGRVAAAG